VVTAGAVIAAGSVVAASVAAGCGVTGVRHRADREKDSSENRKNAH
jgi:serine acetyltransferase